MSKVAVIYYSSTGTNHTTANAVAEGARAAGAEVRVRLVAETAPDAAVQSNPAWKAFVERTAGGLWFQGKLANKVYAGFTSAQNAHGGQESTLLALYNSIYHFGGYIVTPGYTDPLVFAAGGNPYGVSVTAGGGGPTEADLAHARYLGKRVAEVADKLAR